MPLIYLKNKQKGITYVYESENYWDKEKKQSRSHRICIGKLDPLTGDLIPSKRMAAPNRSTKPGPFPVTETKKLFQRYTMQGLLDELDVIECYERPGHDLRFGEMTKRQILLYEALEISPPASL